MDTKVIRKEGNEIVLYDSEGEEVLGRFPFGEGETYASEETARAAAEEREREIQAIAHQETASAQEPTAEDVRDYILQGLAAESVVAPDPLKTYPLRALGDGWVEGPAVVFSPGGEPRDSWGEYFEGDTEFGWAGGTRVAMYHHGMDPVLGRRLLGVENRGWIKTKQDDVAIWVKQQLDLRDEWEEAIYGLVEQDKMSLSSGTAEHTIVRSETGKLMRWLITEISYEPTPAERRTTVRPVKTMNVIPLKSLIRQQEDQPSGPGADRERLRVQPEFAIRGEHTMDLETLIHNITQFVGLEEVQIKAVAGVLNMTGFAKVIKNVDAVIESISVLVPDLSEEQIAQIRQVIALAVGDDAPAEPPPEAPMEAAVPPVMMTAPPAAIAPPPQRARPAYDFRPAPQQQTPGVNRDVVNLRYSGPEIDEADGRVMKDIYGDDYRQLTQDQTDGFWNYIRTGREAAPLMHRQIWHIKHVRAMLKSGASVAQIRVNQIEGQAILGGYAVPPQIADNILVQAAGLTVTRQAGALVIQTAANSMGWVTVTGGNSRYPSGLRGVWAGEAATPTASNFNVGFEDIPVNVYTYKTPFSVSVLEDAINLETVFNQLVGETLAMDEDDAFLIGDGAGKPTGIMPSQTAPTTFTLQAVGTGVADEITWAGLQALRRGIYAQFRQRGVWVGNSVTGGLIERLKDGESRPYVESLDVGEQFLRHTWYESEALPDVASASYPIIYGDFSGYAIVERLGMAMQRYNDSNTGINLVEFHIRRRIGGRVIQPYKFALQRCNATLGNL